MDSIPDEFYLLVKLQDIDVSFNAIAFISDELKNLTQLVKFNAGHNKIEHIPRAIGQVFI
jgi:Leucine-rich repeat (LRR) protein